MSVAILLTQPQLVAKLDSMSDQENLAEDFFVLLQRLVLNSDKHQAILTCFREGFDKFSEDFISNAPNLEQGMQQLQSLLAPFAGKIREFGENPALRGDFAELIEFLASQAVLFLEVVCTLSANDIRAFLSQLLTILTNQFGFGLSSLVGEIWNLIDSITLKLRDFPAATGQEEKELRLISASLLTRIKNILQAQVQLPELSSDQLVGVIMKQLRQMGLEQWLTTGREIAEAIKNTFLAAGTIGDLITKVMGTSVGAAAREPNTGDEYAWYASWLLATRDREVGEIFKSIFLHLMPSDEVWVTSDKSQVVWRTAYSGDICLHEGSNLKWNDAPKFSSTTEEEYVLFPHISAEALETLSKVSWILVEFGKGVWNSVDAAEKGDRASAITHAIWNYFNSGFGAIGQKPFISYLHSATGLSQVHRGWLNSIFPIIGTLVPSIEGRQTEADKDKFLFWIVLFAGDVLERAGHHLLLHTVRDLLLSTLTLINNIGQPQGSDSNHPINKEYTSTWASTGSMIATIIYLKSWYNKKDYKHLFNGFLWVFASMAAGLVGGLTGSLLGSVFSQGFSPKGFGIDLALETGKPLLTHYLNLYSWIENDTDGGTFNADRTGFSGYPDKPSSPYKLPWADDITRMCVQGNMGMWSHFDEYDQIYAVDFGFDQGDLIHAARAGTVVGFHDQVNDDENIGGAWNYIVIRHDHSSESDDIRRIHDKYYQTSDNPVTNDIFITYGVYGHGRKNGVREVFATRGVADTAIIGQSIAQGDPIMKAGNTGISLHNHLHFHVKNNGEPLGSGPLSTAVNLDPATLTGDTMPFVFSNVPKNGVVKSLTFYSTSSS